MGMLTGLHKRITKGLAPKYWKEVSLILTPATTSAYRDTMAAFGDVTENPQRAKNHTEEA